MNTIAQQIKGFVSTLDFDWYTRMEQYFKEESKGRKKIEFISSGYDIDKNGKVIKIAPASMSKDFKEYCWSSYYPGRNIKKEWTEKYGNWIDGVTVMGDYIPSFIISFFGEVPNSIGDLDPVAGVQNHYELYLFIKRLFKIVDDEIETLKAADTSEKATYSMMLDSFSQKLKENIYANYSRVIDAYSFIHDEHLLPAMGSFIENKIKDDVSLIVQQHIDCFSGKLDEMNIMSANNYKIVLGSTIAFIKNKRIPTIKNRIPHTGLLNEFIAYTYNRLFNQLTSKLPAPKWGEFIYGLFEQFNDSSPQSISSNWSRYRPGNYHEVRAKIIMPS